MIGPGTSNLGLASCPIYATAGLAMIVSTVHADELTQCSTVFRTVVSTGKIGDTLANYIGHVLPGTRAELIYKDDSFGRPLASRFKDAAAEADPLAAHH